MELPFDIPGPAFRARQVHSWVFERFAATFEEMTDLPAGLRDELAAKHPVIGAVPMRLQQSDRGDTVKALFPGSYETVAMRYPERRTVCVSSQAGCGLGCTFCATGQMGLIRNLSPWEIVSQVTWAARVFGERPTNVVFMGMGEPMANYAATMDAVRSIHDDIGISARKITVSTVGLVPQMDQLAKEDLPVTLALSLHAPDDATRRTLVPLNDRYPVADVLAAAKRYRRANGRRVTIEYALIDKVNDAPGQAAMLGRLLKGTDMHVNVIPLNPTPGYGVPASRRLRPFVDALIEAGVNATIRDTRGRDIDAACGQLASEER